MSEKERLKEIEERVLVDKVYYKYLDGTKGHWSKVYTLSEGDYNYLKEQAERVQELERKIKRYREALRFYADENNYFVDITKLELPEDIFYAEPQIVKERGKKAREALEG